MICIKPENIKKKYGPIRNIIKLFTFIIVNIIQDKLKMVSLKTFRPSCLTNGPTSLCNV